jgi:hypothetical protein
MGINFKVFQSLIHFNKLMLIGAILIRESLIY